MTWQRRARLFIGVSAAAVAVAVLVGIRERQPQPEAAPAPRMDPAALVESTNATVLQTRGTRQDLRIESKTQLVYADGSSRLEQATITMVREGRTFRIASERAELHDDKARMVFEGNVRISSGDGLEMRSEQATYDDAQGIMETSGPLRFRQGRFHGRGRGATYHRDRDTLLIHQDAHVTGASEEAQGAVEIVSESAELAQMDKYFRFEGGSTFTHGGHTADANTAVAYLSDDGERIETLELHGGAQVKGTEGSAGVRNMQGEDITLAYAEDGQTIRKATLAGIASIGLPGAAAGPLRRIAATRIDVGLASDGTTVTELAAQERVVVDLPAAASAPARQIRAASLDGSGAEGKGLEKVRFEGGVEFRETIAGARTAPAADRLVKARALDVEVGGDIGDIKQAHFSGAVSVQDADLTAQAELVRYDVAGGRAELTSGEGSGTARPHLDDRRGWVEAGRIDVSLGSIERSMTAEQDVRSIFRPQKESPGSGNAPARKMPGMLAKDEPGNVTAARMTYDEAKGLATYAGGANLWQGERAVQGDTLVVDEHKGDLTAKGTARSRMILEQIDPKTKAPEKVETIASADLLVYEDALRRATYTTSAHASGPQGDVVADRIELYLGKAQDSLERAESYVNVQLRLEGRTAWGDRLTYFADEGRYLMNGAPVRIVEQLPTECRETMGKILTFYRSTDTISVDGNEEHRTQTKTAGTCPAPLPLR